MLMSAAIYPIEILPFKASENERSDESCPAIVNILDFDFEGLSQFFTELGEKSFRAVQVFKWIHQRGMDDFSNMTDLSKGLRDRLATLCEVKAPEITKEQVSTDGTVKWLLKIPGGNHIETVFIPEAGRGTLCVSSQVGCALNCTFCSTATQGFNRNLTVSEIIGQVFLARQRLTLLESQGAPPSKITNVVMMGMGEPLLNYDAVIKALSIMRSDLAYALPRRRVTLSTSGVVPNIDRLSVDADVSLALSLHAAHDALRDQLVPLNKKYPIAVLMDACRRYASDRRDRHITMEYVMLRGVNDKVEYAKKLVKVLQGIPCKINLIPFNPYPGTPYERSKREDIEHFRQVLSKAGYITTIRKTRGEDIDAACGQLVGQIIDKTRRNERFLKSQQTGVAE